MRAEEGEDPCQMYQLLRDADGNATAEITMFPLPPGEQAVAGATILTPLETLLTAQLVMQVDGGAAKRYPFTFCTAIGCIARVGFTAAEVDAFRGGAEATWQLVPVAAPGPDRGPEHVLDRLHRSLRRLVRRFAIGRRDPWACPAVPVSRSATRSAGSTRSVQPSRSGARRAGQNEGFAARGRQLPADPAQQFRTVAIGQEQPLVRWQYDTAGNSTPTAQKNASHQGRYPCHFWSARKSAKLDLHSTIHISPLGPIPRTSTRRSACNRIFANRREAQLIQRTKDAAGQQGRRVTGTVPVVMSAP